MWFEVDKQGLGKLLERRGKEFILFELIQNAWDENTTRVDVTLERIAGTHSARITVEDDSPNGFADLTHSFTLFAESTKKADATKRGRFNLGEKLVLALCDEAEIRSTTGGVRFDASGRHTIRAKREAGSIFTGTLKMTNTEIAVCGVAVTRLIVPPNIALYYNGGLIESRQPVKVIEATLATEIADDEGRLRRTARKTTIEFYEVNTEGTPGGPGGETAALYELGIPVVTTDDRFHINILQKVPLNLDRDNVTPAFLSSIRALATEHMTEQLTAEDANSTWVRDAMQTHGDDLPDDTITKLVDLRFGDKRVAFDPSDLEANSRAMAAGYTVVYGNQLSSAEWRAVKRVDAIPSAGKVIPTYSPYSEGGEPSVYVDESRWTDGMRFIAHAVTVIGEKVLERKVRVLFESGRFTDPWGANYGHATLTFNYERLGKRWFEDCIGPHRAALTAPVLSLILHELGHEFEENHLTDDFHRALTRIGAKLAILAATDDAVRKVIAP